MLSLRGTALSHDSARTDSCNGCDKLRGFLLDGLALVPLRRAREAVGAPERACAGHLEVAGGGGDGGEWCGWEEERAGGGVQDEREERAAEEGAEEVVPPGEVVGLECGQEE